MNRNQESDQDPAPAAVEVDWDAGFHPAIAAVEKLTRDGALDLACSLCVDEQVRWIARACRGKYLDAKCLGRFWLANNDRPDLKWPAVVFAVASKTRGMLVSQQALLMLYYGPDAKWTVCVEEPVERDDGTRGLVVRWEQYLGDAKGPPGIVNGDDAGGPSPERRESVPASSAAMAPDSGNFAPSRPRSSPAPAQTPPAANGRVRRAGARRKAAARSPKSEGSPGTPSSGTAGIADSPAQMTPQQEFALRLLRLWQG